MRTDKLVYLLLKLAPAGFFSLIGRNPDIASAYEFKSVELKETAFRMDGVFVPKSVDEATYFVEAQFQPDENFYARFFAEIFLYLKQYPTAQWKAVALYPSRNVEQKNIEPYKTMLELEQVQRIYLNEVEDSTSVSAQLFKLLIAPSPNSAETLAREIVRRATKTEVDLIEQIISYKFSKLSREEVRAMLGIQQELLKDTQFYKDVFQEGVQEGKRRGLEEGERRAKLSLVPTLRRLGLSDEDIAKELNLSLPEVQSV